MQKNHHHVILDSCVVKNLLKKNRLDLLKGTKLMDFQKKELTRSETLSFTKAGGVILEPYEKQDLKRRDDNFLLQDLLVVTYDKKLKRSLNKLGLLCPSCKSRVFNL